MTVRNLVAAFALSAMTALPVAAQTTPANDAAIKSRVETRLKSADSLKDDHIAVSVDNGVVTLKGKVHSAAESTQAAELAKVAGVSSVENKLDVDADTKGAMDKAEAKTKDAAGKTKDATVKGAEKTGKATKDVAGTTGEVIDDSWITTKIKTDFVNEDTLKGSDINVDTNDHVVTLKGTVASAAGKTRAEDIAKKTKGVHRVVTTLTIGPKK